MIENARWVLLNKFRILRQREMWLPDRGLHTGFAPHLGDLVTSLRRAGEKSLMPYPMKQRGRIRKFCFCLPCRSNVVRLLFIDEFWFLSNLIPRVEL